MERKGEEIGDRFDVYIKLSNKAGARMYPFHAVEEFLFLPRGSYREGPVGVYLYRDYPHNKDAKPLLKARVAYEKGLAAGLEMVEIEGHHFEATVRNRNKGPVGR